MSNFLFQILNCKYHRGYRFKTARRMRLGNFLTAPPSVLKQRRLQEKAFDDEKKRKEKEDFENQPIIIDPTFIIKVGAILQRNPITMSQLNEFEEEYMRYRHVKDSIKTRGLFEFTGGDEENSAGIRAMPNGDRYFNIVPEEPAPPLEYSTDEGNLKNLGRKLDRKLYLSIRPSYNPSIWTFPSFLYSNSLKEGIHSVVRERLNEIFPNAQLYHLGHAPLAHFVEHLKSPIENAKNIATFYLKSQLISGDIKNFKVPEALEFAWLTKEEIQEKADPHWFKSISPILST
jgi:hypothetical protein